VRDADLRFLHPEAPLEGAALRRAGPRRPLCARLSVARPRRVCSSANRAQTAQHVPELSCCKRTCILRASAERLQAQARSYDTVTIQFLTPWSGRAQGGFPLHWPLINSDHMRTRLAQRELEAKRLEDARRWRSGPLLQRQLDTC